MPLQDGGNSLTLRVLSPDERQILDQAARAVLAQFVAAAVAAGTEAMTWQLQPGAPPTVPRLLDMMLLTSEQKFMDSGQPPRLACRCDQPPSPVRCGSVTWRAGPHSCAALPAQPATLSKGQRRLLPVRSSFFSPVDLRQ